jgi:hypothetical protein
MLRGLRPLVHLAGFLLCASVLAPGCKQGAGDRCEIESDCEEGLECVITGSNTTDGVCRAPMTVAVSDAGSPPVTTPVDGGATDAGADAVADAGADTATLDATTGEDAVDAADAPDASADTTAPDASTLDGAGTDVSAGG